MQGNNTPSRPSSLACVPCRRRHLKCDALMPVCTRCQTTDTGTECRYVRSRRGLRSRHGHGHARSPSAQLDDDLFAQDAFSDWLNTPDLDPQTAQALFQPLDLQTIDNPALPGPVTGPDSALVLPDPIPRHLPTSPPPSQSPSTSMAYDPMIQLYYQNFHASHPLLIPRKALHGPAGQLVPPFLLAVMRYIGAHYYPDQSFQQSFRQPAYAVLEQQNPNLSPHLTTNVSMNTNVNPGMSYFGFKVQALLLLAIVDHSHGHEESAQVLLQTAISLALEIGMHRGSFSRRQAAGHPVLEESWRRTYWELYVVDGLLAAMRDQSVFRLYRQPTEVRLPCSERVYNSDTVIPTRQTLVDFQNSWTSASTERDETQTGPGSAPGERKFSSFTYRINAVRTLGMVLDLNSSLEATPDSQTETIDALLTAALLDLPSLQGEGYDSSSHDELIFQAQMTLYLAMIHLHHPRSGIRFAYFQAHNKTNATTTTGPGVHPRTTSCTRLRAQAPTPVSTDNLNMTIHPERGPESRPDSRVDLEAHKLLRAADLLSGLATLPSPIRSRSPFFTCALAMCVVVHTAAGLGFAHPPSTSTFPTCTSASGAASWSREQSLRARIQLSIGALHALGRVWPLARVVRQQMVDMYQEVSGGAHII